MPPVSRALLGCMAAVTLPCALQLVSPYQVALLWPLVRRRGQIWRVVTSFMYAGQGINMLMNAVFFYQTSSSVEKLGYLSDTVDYAWSMLGMSTLILAFNYSLGTPFLLQALSGALMWSVHLPNHPVSMMGFVQIPGKFLAVAMLCLEVIISGPQSARTMLTGVVAGFLWHVVRQAPRAPRRGVLAPLARFVSTFVTPLTHPPARLRESVSSGVRTTSFGTVYAPRAQPRAAPRAARSTGVAPDRNAILRATEARLRSQS